MKQGDHALHMFQQSIYKYINSSGTSKLNIEKDRLKEMFKNAYTYFQKRHIFFSVFWYIQVLLAKDVVATQMNKQTDGCVR